MHLALEQNWVPASPAGVHGGPQGKAPTASGLYLSFERPPPPGVWGYAPRSSPCSPRAVRFASAGPRQPETTEASPGLGSASPFLRLRSSRISDGRARPPARTGSSAARRTLHVAARPSSPPLCREREERGSGLAGRLRGAGGRDASPASRRGARRPRGARQPSVVPPPGNHGREPTPRRPAA